MPLGISKHDFFEDVNNLNIFYVHESCPTFYTDLFDTSDKV